MWRSKQKTTRENVGFSIRLQDPFADALGGIPPGIFGFVDKELDFFKEPRGRSDCGS